MSDLVLHVKKEYFQLIAEGNKKEEYRKVCLYWGKRLDGKTFDRVVIACGYPSRLDDGLWLSFPWNGYYMKTIYHKEWNNGDAPVIVYAIRLQQEQP
jgi:hypothetical protein